MYYESSYRHCPDSDGSGADTLLHGEAEAGVGRLQLHAHHLPVVQPPWHRVAVVLLPGGQLCRTGHQRR